MARIGSSPTTGVTTEDTPAPDGGTGVPVLAVRRDDPVTYAGADGEYTNIQTDIYGALWVSPTAYRVPTLSSQTPLAGSASFTSPWINTEGINAIRIGVLSDVLGTLFTQHSTDGGATIIRNSSQPVTANLAEFLSFHPRASSFRIVYTNGSSAQSSFDLETFFHVVALTPTQSLVSAKLGRTSLALQTRAMVYDYENDETVGVAPQIRDLYTVQRTSMIADNFRQTAGLDLQTWDTAVTGSGTAAIVNGRLELDTGITANSTAQVRSEVLGRFMSGSHQVFRVGIKIPDSGFTNNKRRWGVFSDVSGYFFELDGTTLYAVSRRNSTDTRIASTSWSEITTFGNGTNQSARYEITYFGNTALFVVNGETHHRMSGEVGGLPRTNETNFPNTFECVNSGGSTSDVTLVVTGTSQQRYGPDHVVPRMKRIAGAATTVIKSDAGNLHRIVVANGSGTSSATVYDNTAAVGTIITILNLNKLQGSIDFGGVFSIGLTVVTTGSDSDITLVYD